MPLSCSSPLRLPRLHRAAPALALIWLVPLAPLAPLPAHASDAPRSASAARAAASAPEPASPSDPLLQLRQRLSERLSKGKTSEAGHANDLRVVSVQSASPAASKPRAGKGGSKEAAAAPAHGHAGAAHWDYEGGAGPAAWGALEPAFALCSSGQRQSPIDIRGGLAVDLDPVRFDYKPSRFGVLDNGHTVQVNVAPGNRIEIGGKAYELVQFHFHRPSEERIDGRQFEMSLHLVHRDEQGKLAVVALLFDKGPAAQPTLQQVWNHLPLERGDEAPAPVTLDPGTLLPADRRYYTYMGSLTTPPCSEGVQWVVMRQPVAASPEQIELFARIYPMNARPLQPAAGRRILQSN